MSGAAIVLLIIVVLAVIAGIWVLSTYNNFIKAKQAVLASESGITVELKRRLDLIPALVKTVKASAAFESSTLENVIKARSTAVSNENKPLADRAQGENMLTEALGRLFAVAEQYPVLQTVQNFRELQDQLTETEDRIAANRRLYNLNVQSYMTKREQMPSGLVANMFSSKLPPFAMFTDDTPGIQNMPELDF